jgi:hypothetical protein
VPDGTKVAVSTLGGCNHRDAAGSCIDSAGGVIANGAPSPELGAGDRRITVLDVQDGAVTAIYSTAGAQELGTGGSATARVQFLPAGPDGVRIGNRTIAIGNVTLTGFASGVIIGAGTVARNATATYVVTDLLDTAGQPIPDGVKVAVSTLGGCNHRDADGTCINSLEGAITDGAQGPELGAGDNRIKIFEVQGGAISFTYQAPNAGGTTVLQILPARPSGHRVGNRAFAVRSVLVP